MAQLENFEGRAIGLFRIAGYGLLVLSLFDYIDILIPPRFLDPSWEFQTIANLVDRVPVPLLGLVFIFSGENLFREKIEKHFLRFLSWAALLVGLLFLILIPLGINDSFRLDKSSEAIVRNQANQQLAGTQQVEDILNKATSPEQINNVLTALNNQKPVPQLKDPQGVRKQLLSNIETYQKNIRQQAESTRKSKQRRLLKAAIKMNLGSFVSAALFIYLWRITAWARPRQI